LAYNTQNNYTGDGIETDYQIDFPYIAQAHVKAYVEDTLITDWSWVGASMIRFDTPPGAGDNIIIRRETPYADRLVEFQNGSILSETDLNLAIKQVFYSMQEIWESELYLRGPAGYGGIDGEDGAPGADGTPSPWEDLNELLTDLIGQISIDHIDSLTRERINYMDALDGYGGFILGGGEEGTFETLHQVAVRHQDEIGANYSAIGIAAQTLEATRGEITTLGLLIQSGEYGWFEHDGVTDGPLIDGEQIVFSGGATANYSIIGSGEGDGDDIYVYNLVGDLPLSTEIGTGQTSGAYFTLAENYQGSGGIERVRVAEEFLSAADLQWTVKLEYNNEAGDWVSAGVGLFVDDETATSDFLVYADNFAVVNYGAGAGADLKYPFIVSTVKGVGSKVGINGDLIVDGSILAEAIETVNLRLIGEGSLTTASFADFSDGSTSSHAGFKLDAANNTLQMHGSSTFGGTVYINTGSYLLLNGKYLTSTGKGKRYPKDSSANMTPDGQTHQYYWSGSAWVQIMSCGLATDGSDKIVLDIYNPASKGSYGVRVKMDGSMTGWFSQNYAIAGINECTGTAVLPFGVYGKSTTYAGLYGWGGNYGVIAYGGVCGGQFQMPTVAEGGDGQIHLYPSTETVPPSHAAFEGTVYTNDYHDMYICVVDQTAAYSSWRGIGVHPRDLSSYALADGTSCCYESGGTYYYRVRLGTWQTIWSYTP
jgi:hypothetical protein